MRTGGTARSKIPMQNLSPKLVLNSFPLMVIFPFSELLKQRLYMTIKK